MKAMKENNYLCPKCRAQLVPNKKIVLLAKPVEGPVRTYYYSVP